MKKKDGREQKQHCPVSAKTATVIVAERSMQLKKAKRQEKNKQVTNKEKTRK